jgi:hypothetical protein
MQIAEAGLFGHWVDLRFFYLFFDLLGIIFITYSGSQPVGTSESCIHNLHTLHRSDRVQRPGFRCVSPCRRNQAAKRRRPIASNWPMLHRLGMGNRDDAWTAALPGRREDGALGGSIAARRSDLAGKIRPIPTSFAAGANNGAKLNWNPDRTRSSNTGRSARGCGYSGVEQDRRASFRPHRRACRQVRRALPSRPSCWGVVLIPGFRHQGG